MRILFVCTGNIFRSLTAHYALRRELGDDGSMHVSSAGTEDFPHVVAPVVSEYLLSCGLDVSTHRRRTLTGDLLREAHYVVAMSDDHQAFIREHYGMSVPLFTEACGLAATPLPDVDDVIVDHESNPRAVAAHVRATIDTIIRLTPQLARKIKDQRSILVRPS